MADNEYAARPQATIGQKYMMRADPNAAATENDEGLTVVRVADRKPVANYVRSAPDRRLHGLYFWRDTAIVQEITDIAAGDEGGRIHLTRYDLLTGTRAPLHAADGRRLGYLSAAALAGDQFAVAIEKDGQKDRCLHVFDLPTGTGTDVSCMPPGQNGIFSIRGSDSGFTYLTTDGATLASCRIAYRIPLPARPTVDSHVVGGYRGCHVFDHTQVGNWDVWSEIPEAADKINNHGFAVLKAQQGPHNVTLGVIDSSSLITCGSHVYWRQPKRPQHKSHQIVRWQPGHPKVEVVYEADTDPDGAAWTLNFPECSQNVLTLVQSRPTARHPAAREVRFLPAT
nr:hypothetical protein [Kibdelosporangium sp. MJ126-NF4]